MLLSAGEAAPVAARRWRKMRRHVVAIITHLTCNPVWYSSWFSKQVHGEEGFCEPAKVPVSLSSSPRQRAAQQEPPARGVMNHRRAVLFGCYGVGSIEPTTYTPTVYSLPNPSCFFFLA